LKYIYITGRDAWTYTPDSHSKGQDGRLKKKIPEKVNENTFSGIYRLTDLN
jgi:hypothetical protein